MHSHLQGIDRMCFPLLRCHSCKCHVGSSLRTKSWASGTYLMRQRLENQQGPGYAVPGAILALGALILPAARGAILVAGLAAAAHRSNAPGVRAFRTAWGTSAIRRQVEPVPTFLGRDEMKKWSRGAVIRAGPMHFMALWGHRAHVRPTVPVPLR